MYIINNKEILVVFLVMNLLGTSIIECAATTQSEQIATEIDLGLIHAAGVGNKEKVHSLINKGANVNAADKNGDTALIRAANKGNKVIVELLIDAGASINTADRYGNTALILAAYEGYIDIVDSLIKKGANINIADKYGNTALMLAAYTRQKDIVRLLIFSGANVAAVNSERKTAAEWVRNSELWASEQFMKIGAEIVKMLESEPSRREDTVKKWIANNIGKFSETIGFMPDLSKIIAEYGIEYNSLPLEYRLAN